MKDVPRLDQLVIMGVSSQILAMSNPIDAPHWIRAEIDTVIKPGPNSSDMYPQESLIRARRGDSFFVSNFRRVPGHQWAVKLVDPKISALRERVIFDGKGAYSQWLKSWENDTQESDDSPVLGVTSNIPNDSPVGASLKPGMPFETRITPHITYGEFAKYQSERAFDYEHQCQTAYELAMFIEKVRAEFGGNPVVITSGHRPPKINRAIGGAVNSEHLFLESDQGAVDFWVKGANIYDVQDYCDREWPYSVGYGADRGFIHLGMRPGRPRVRWNY